MALYDSPTPNSQNSSRLLIAVLLCGLTLLASDYLTQRYLGTHLLGTPIKTAAAPTVVPAAAVAAPLVVAQTPVSATLLPVGNERVAGHISTQGGSLNQLTLKQYRDEITEPAGFEMLAPAKLTANSSASATYIVAGWQGAGVEGPSQNTVWQVVSGTLGGTQNLTLQWANSTGQRFTRTWQPLPNSYLWQVTERAENTAALPVTLTPYAQVVRHGGYVKTERSNWVNYFGPMGQIQQGTETLLKEHDFKSLKADKQSETWQGHAGWWGVTSQYFAAAIIPPAAQATARQFAYRTENGQDVYTAGVQFAPAVVPTNGHTELRYMVYAGPKHYPMLTEAGAGLEQTISWGWFEPLVKGLYYALAWLHTVAPNWGVAVMLLTLLLKIATYPLANTSYRAMAKMKKLQPQVEALKKQHEGNQQALALAMMALYKEKKVNPLSGCWPMLIQIPIFFAMYKVVLVMFEFRHASFLWMPDLAMHDPFYVLPIAMGVSMFIQFKLNPTPTDPVQEMMFKWMPLMMTVLFLWFPAGLVLYWLTNNVLSIGQQWLILKREKAV
jgi:YidC/Oxa1 family membrane protein insertase